MYDIAIIEDEPEVARTMVTMLSLMIKDQVETCVYTSLREFMDADHDPDVILLDLNLPDSKGAKTAEHIGAISNAPIVILTADDDPATKHRIEALGYEYYVKPDAYGAAEAIAAAMYHKYYSEPVNG